MPDELYVDWGERLRQHRTKAGLSQVELGARAGTTGAHVSNIERGRTSVSDGLRMRLAAELGTTAGELFPYPDAVPA